MRGRLQNLLPAVIAAVFPVFAPAADYCISAQKLSPHITSCKTNGLFVQASRNCIDKLTSEIQLQQTALSLAMQQLNAASSSAQDAKLANNTQNLDKMRVSLNNLLASALKARGEVENYSGLLVWPGPIKPEVMASGKLRSYLRQFDCFGNSWDALNSDITRLEKKIAEMQTTQAAGKQLQKKDDVALTRLKTDSANNAKTVKSTFGKGSTDRVPSGESDNVPSTITGEVHHDEPKP